MTKKRTQSDKVPMSFKQNERDQKIKKYILSTEIKDSLGTSTYLKLLVEKDMKEKGIW